MGHTYTQNLTFKIIIYLLVDVEIFSLKFEFNFFVTILEPYFIF